jgi:pimeloyl-ACP methyl ester carboxylesterase
MTLRRRMRLAFCFPLLAASSVGLGAQRSVERVLFQPYLFETTDRSIQTMTEWGMLSVPERHGKPNGRRIQLALIRFRSTAKQPGPPIIWLAGGPGLDAIDAARQNQPSGYARQASMLRLYLKLRELGDVIMFDQRGIGYSRPSLKCLEPGPPLPLDRPTTAADLITADVARATACRTLWQRENVDLSAYNSEEIADDVDAIRRAVGASRMAIIGGSYGAHLGLTTIRRHGDRVAWAVLRNVEGPDDGADLPGRMDEILREVDRAVRTHPDWKSIFPDFVGTVRTTIERLQRAPARVELKDPAGGAPTVVTVGDFDLRVALVGTRGLTEEIRQLPARFAAMQRGDFAWLAQQALALRRSAPGNAQQPAIDCADGVSAERLALVRQSAATAIVGNAMDIPWPESCPAWGVRDLGAQNRSPVRSTVPVLLISGELDGLTPPANALAALRTLPNGQHLLIRGVAHGVQDAYFSSPDIMPLVFEFARTGRISRDRVGSPLELSPPR